MSTKSRLHCTWKFLFIFSIVFQTLRDNEWSNMKRATEKKVQTLAANENKPEDQKVNCKPLSPIDEIVLDILGKGRVRIFEKLTVLSIYNLSVNK